MTAKKIDAIKKELFSLTGLEHFVLTDSCNTAINMAYGISKKLSKTKCYLIDPFGGGWHEHLHASKRFGFDINIIKTICFSFDRSVLDSLDENSILIIPSLSEYCYLHPIHDIADICRNRGALLINDCCGSVTVPDLLVGDILVCSFGKLKAINNHSGGFLSIKNHKLRTIENFDDYCKFDETRLFNKITNAVERVNRLNSTCLDIMHTLKRNKKAFINNSDILNYLIMAHYETVDERDEIIEMARSVSDIYYQYPNKPRGLITLTPESQQNLIEAGCTLVGRRVLTHQQELHRRKFQ